MTRYTTAVLLAVLAAIPVLSASGDDTPPLGHIEVLLHGPDGQPLANVPVQLTPDADIVPDNVRKAYNAPRCTDASGRLAFEYPEGLCRFRIVADGVGFGATGTFEVPIGGTACPAIPPLAPLAAIEGRIAPDCRGEGDRLVYECQPWGQVEARPDEAGRFSLTGLVPGGTLTFTGSKGRRTIGVPLAPGQTLGGLRFDELDKPPTPTTQPAQAYKPEPWKLKVAGRVVDTAGRPVAGATVYVIYDVGNGWKSYERTAVVKTDNAGKFVFNDLHRGSFFTNVATVVAHKLGRPIASTVASMSSDGEVTLVIPDWGGRLAVSVTGPNGSVAHCMVVLQNNDWHAIHNMSPVSMDRENREALEVVLTPSALANKDGVATFGNLLPGNYTVWAIWDGHGESFRGIHSVFPLLAVEGKSYAVLRDIPVRANRTGRVSVAIRKQPFTAAFRVLAPDGTPVANRSIGIDWGRASENSRSSSSTNPDNNGRFTHTFAHSGLWRISCRTRLQGVRSIPVRHAPYLDGQAVVAVSGLTRADRIADVRLTRHDPGTLKLQLLGLDGKPARGSVVITAGGDKPDYAAATDADGRAVFTGLRHEYLQVAGYVDGIPAPRPTPQADLDELARLPTIPVAHPDVPTNSTVAVVLRQELWAYIAGTIRPADGTRLADYSISGPNDPLLPAVTLLDTQSGAFRCGPLPPGKATFRLWRRDEGRGNMQAGTLEVDAPGGRVTRVEFHALPLAELKPSPASSRWDWSLSGQVLMSDGKTPAWSARVLHVGPQSGYALKAAWCDARGQFEMSPWGGSSYPLGRNQPAFDQTGEPAVIAWLPGRCGATILPLKPETDTNKKLRLVLPPAIERTGVVTVGGKPASDWPATIGVLAYPRDRDGLEELLSVRTSADRDGNFTLAGLTPGRYLVQAALDDIWLSPAVELTVTEKTPAGKPLELAIPAPGGSAVVRLVDAKGNPLPDVQVVPAVPPGPLTDEIRPKHLATDSTGEVLIDGLPAGEATLTIPGRDGEFRFTVPPAGEIRRVEYLKVKPAR